MVGAIFWAIGQPINPFTVILYSLCIGNFLSPPMQWLHALYEKPAPYDWIIFLVVLCVVTVPVYALTQRDCLVVRPACSAIAWAPDRHWLEDALPDHHRLRRDEFSLRAGLRRASSVATSNCSAWSRSGAARLEVQDEELQRAREIQESLLPKVIPQLPGFEVASSWQPAHAVGGDYFDVLKLSENQLAICIADVSGKGVPAALLMANVQASLRASVRDLDSPARVCSIINGMLCESITADKFVTFFCGVLDADLRHLSLLQCRPSLSHSGFFRRSAHAGPGRRGAGRFPGLDVSGLEREPQLRRQAASLY